MAVYCDEYYYTSSWLSTQGYCRKKERLGETDSRVSKSEESRFCIGYTNYKGCPVYNSSDSGTLCIITQALCYYKGCSDRCSTMMTIRKFRDKVLAADDEGKSMISQYYEVSKTVVGNIRKLASSTQEEIYEWVCGTFIEPCIAEINAGRSKSAIGIYKRMLSELISKYGSSTGVATCPV